MKIINFTACLFLVIICSRLLISSKAIETNKLRFGETYIDQSKCLVPDHATGTIINSNEGDGGDARDCYSVKHEVVKSKTSQGGRGPSGGSNIDRQPRTVKSNAVPLIQNLSFYSSLWISFTLFLVLSF